MFRKFLLGLVCALTVSAGAFAGERVAISINFYDDNGDITPVREFPAGVTWQKRIRFSNRRLKGFAYPIHIDLGRASGVDQVFRIKGTGRLLVSVNCGAGIAGRPDGALKIRCLKFFLNGVSGKKTPFVFSGWTVASNQISVKDGDIITIRAEFEKAE